MRSKIPDFPHPGNVLHQFMTDNDVTIRKLNRITDIPYNTITDILYRDGYISWYTDKELCSFFNTDVGYWRRVWQRYDDYLHNY